MDIKLSSGALKIIMQGGNAGKPVLQVLGSKKITNKEGSSRLRLHISDGTTSLTSAILGTKLTEKFSEGELEKYTVIKVEKLFFNAVGEKPVIILLDLTMIKKGAEVGNRLGNPVQLDEPSGNSAVRSQTTNDAFIAAAASSSQRNVQHEFTPKLVATFRTAEKVNANYNSPTASTSPLTNRNSMSFGNTSISNCATVPIRDINPYNTKISIKARVTNKGAIRTWSNSRGNGKLFNIDLLDESGEIRMTGFNNAVDQFYDLIKVNEVYKFFRFSAKPANKQWTSLKHDYEISFTNDTILLPCLEKDSQELPQHSFMFREISSIADIEINKIIDVIGVCKRRGELQTITSKRQSEQIGKRDIFLVDRSQTEVRLTLWGKSAENFEDDTNPVVAVKGVKLGEYDGKYITMLHSSLMLKNPDIPESKELRKWFDELGATQEVKTLCAPRSGAGGTNTEWKLLHEAAAANPNPSETGFYFRSKVTVMSMKRENTLYKACTADKCNKKVVDMGNGLYRCEKCDKENPGFKWRMIINTCFGDFSESIWTTCFQKHLEIILNTNAEDLDQLIQNDQECCDQVIKKTVFQSFIVKFFAKNETYNHETKRRFSIIDIQPLNFVDYAKKLVAEIKETIN